MAVRLQNVVEPLRSFLTAGLMLDPWLAGLQSEHFTFNSQSLLHEAATAITGEHWREPVITQTLGSLAMMRSLADKSVLEVLNSSAAVIGHQQFGRLHVDLGVANEAIRRLRAFLELHGFGPLVWIYLVVTLVENYTTLAHYGSLSETEFVQGLRHRPWVRGSLDDEMALGLCWGIFRLVVREGRRCVEPTRAGAGVCRQAREMLESSGYLAERLRLIQLTQFDLVDEYDRYAEIIMPALADHRRAFTAFAGLRPGMRVLELGCGMGTQTFEGGLLQAVGREGRLVGVDPSVGMLRRAQQKAWKHRAPNVEFVQAKAEALPFPDGAFDAAVGFQFIEFTEMSACLEEVRRVVRPGGTVAVGGACNLGFQATWLREWFAPIFMLAERHGMEVRSPFYDPGMVPRMFLSAPFDRTDVLYGECPGLLSEARATVGLLVQGVSFFQEVFELLPWAARHELIGELESRGAEVCRRAAEERLEQRVVFPMEYVRATMA